MALLIKLVPNWLQTSISCWIPLHWNPRENPAVGSFLECLQKVRDPGLVAKLDIFCVAIRVMSASRVCLGDERAL